MKTTKKLLLILALAFCGFMQAQEATDTVVITLTVNTDSLGDDRQSPGGCTFTVVPADKVLVNDPNNPKTFTIQVDSTDVIEWQGITTNGEDVKIKRITFIGGTNILGSGFVKGDRSNGKEKVKVKPNRKTPRDKDFEYSIRFKTKGELFSFYEIDPRIKVGNQ
jgi:hypothetical protein